MSALPLYHSRDMERSPNQMPLMLDLRELAAARDKKRDVAALTMNMAISAARQVSGDQPVSKLTHLLDEMYPDIARRFGRVKAAGGRA